MAKGVKFRFDMAGLKEAETRVKALRSSTAPVREAAQSLFAEATKIMNASKLLVPVDTGFLRQSGHVQIPAINGDRVTVTLGYAAEYALYVHEHLGARHKVGTAKFLEIPYLAWKRGALKTIADSFRAARSIGIGSRALA